MLKNQGNNLYHKLYI